MFANATDDPRLMNDSSTDTIAVITIVLTGIRVLGWSLDRPSASKVNGGGGAYLGDLSRERDSIVSRERPELSGCRGHETDQTADPKNPHDHGHSRCTPRRSSTFQKHVKVRIAKCRGLLHNLVQVSEAKEVGNQHRESQSTIEQHADLNGPRDYFRCILDFFCHLTHA